MEPYVTLRMAALSDADALSRIYAPYVLNTTVTFEYEPPTAEAFAARIAGIYTQYPYLVCELDGGIAGYAYAHRLFDRAAYGWNAELSVYVRTDCRGHGVGKRLCRAVTELLRLQGVLFVYAIIAAPNEPSERLHASLGFARCAEFTDAGFKHGGWHSTIWYKKALGKRTAPPAPVIPVTRLAPAQVEAALQTAVGPSQ